ncbi:MAG: hypothetical protein ACK57G_14530 [Planctomycetota bacterium]
MAPERLLGYVTHHERRDSPPGLQFSDRFAEICLFQIIDLVLVPRLEEGLKALFDSLGGAAGAWKALQTLAQFRNSGYPDLIPIKVGLLQLRKSFVGLVGASVLQAARVEQVLQNRPLGAFGGWLEVLLQRFVERIDFGSTVAGCHGYTLEMGRQSKW